MQRTQIYLTETERQALRILAIQTGRTQSDLVGEAIDQFVGKHMVKDRRKLL